jgi:serine/threonine protein kinase
LPHDRAGTYIKHYYLIGMLGQGGMSDVYLGFDLKEARLVAVKFLLDSHRFSTNARGRFLREADIYQQIDHPNVVRLFDRGSTPEGGYFIVQEFLRGTTLTELLEENPHGLDVPLAVKLLEDICEALRAAHRMGVIHRDVKPDNILVDRMGKATLMDFGIARADDELVKTSMRTVMGTLMYAAPEQRMGYQVDKRADVFSVGAVFYEMLTGRRVIDTTDPRELLEGFDADIDAPSSIRLGLPKVLDELCAKLLAPEVHDRYQDLKEVHILLGKLRIEADAGVKDLLFGSEQRRFLDEAIGLLQQGEEAQARALLEKIPDEEAEEFRAQLQHLKGLIEMAENRPSAAIPFFQGALKEEPDNRDILYDCALAWIRQGRFEDAARVLQSSPGQLRLSFATLGLLDVISALPETPRKLLDTAGDSNFLGILKALEDRG